MSIFISILLTFFSICSLSAASSSTYIPFDTNVYAPLQQPSLIYEQNKKDRIGLFVTPWYHTSTNATALGIRLSPIESNLTSINRESFLPPSSFIHLGPVVLPASLTLSGDLKLRPSTHTWGVGFIAQARFTERLLLRFSGHCIGSSRSLNATVDREQKQVIAGTSYGILDYFNGTLQQTTDPARLQAPLTHGLFAEKKSRTGFAEGRVELGLLNALGSSFENEVYLSFGIPSSAKPRGIYLFEPNLGNSAWSIGGGFIGKGYLVERENWDMHMDAQIELRHYFDHDEIRMLGARTQDFVLQPWSYYSFFGKRGVRGVFPAANVLTQPVRVFQGQTLDTTLQLGITHKIVGFRVGYRAHAQSGERLEPTLWDDGTYGFARLTYDTNNPFGPGAGGLSGDFIAAEMLDTATAATPGYLLNTWYGALSFDIRFSRACLGLEVGGQYSYAQHRTAINGPGFWGRLTLIF